MTLFGSREDKESKQLREDFRRVFSSEDGQRVLMYILTDLGWFDEAKDERAQVLQNYGKHLLEIMGILHEFNAREFVKKMFELPVYDPGGRHKYIDKEKD